MKISGPSYPDSSKTPHTSPQRGVPQGSVAPSPHKVEAGVKTPPVVRTSSLVLPPALAAFSRFFSLPRGSVERIPTLLRGLEQAEPGRTLLPRQREARLLAAAAAEDKGLRLSGEALERYAAALDGDSVERFPAPGPDTERSRILDTEPESRSEKDGGNKNGSGDGSAGTQDQGGHPDGNAAGDRGGGKRRYEKKSPQKEDVTAGELRAALQDNVFGETPLGFLNRVKGRYSGKRWIVLPFTLDEGERVLRACLRLLEAEGAEGPCVERLSLDISAETAGEAYRRLFIYEPEGPLKVYVQPGKNTAALRSMEKALARCMGLSAGQIMAQNADFTGSFQDSRLDALPSINEEV